MKTSFVPVISQAEADGKWDKISWDLFLLRKWKFQRHRLRKIFYDNLDLFNGIKVLSNIFKDIILAYLHISEHKHRKDESKMQQIKDQRRRVVVVIMEVGIITLGVVGNSNLITSCSRARRAPRNAESYLIFSNFPTLSAPSDYFCSGKHKNCKIWNPRHWFTAQCSGGGLVL